MITFRPLSEPTVSKILDLQLRELLDRLAKQKLELELADDARAVILKAGYDPVNGARPLRRAIERLLTRPLSNKIVEETFNSGDTVVVSAADDDKLRFESKREPA